MIGGRILDDETLTGRTAPSRVRTRFPNPEPDEQGYVRVTLKNDITAGCKPNDCLSS